MKREKIKVEERKITGKKVRKLRREGLLPVNIYGRDFKSLACQVTLKEFQTLYNKVHETGLVDLEVDSKTFPVLIHNVQLDPRTQSPVHADFYKVDLKAKIKAQIPVVAIGDAPAVLDKKGLLLQLLSELEVEALPTDLPEKIEINIDSLSEVNQEIQVSAVKVPSRVTLLNESSQVIIKIGELVTREAEEQAKQEEAASAEAKASTEAAQPEATVQPEAEQKEVQEEKPKEPQQAE